ncbi:MAG: hypothetical protein IPM82_12095 [Saprospiraceae bacterium]|nr:hypothetical protein [Saprospiraceae bacterium]
MKPATIELNIEELLHGFSPHEAFWIEQALVKELSRLLREQGLPLNLTHSPEVQISNLDVGTILLPEKAAARVVGQGLSKALHTGFQKELSLQQPLKNNNHE